MVAEVLTMGFIIGILVAFERTCPLTVTIASAVNNSSTVIEMNTATTIPRSNLLVAYCVIYIVTALAELLVVSEKHDQTLLSIHKVFSNWFLFSYLFLVFGVRDIFVILIFVVYMYGLGVIVTLHDFTVKRGRTNRNTLYVYFAADLYIAGALIVALAVLFYNGSVTPENQMILPALFFYAVFVRGTRFYFYYWRIPRICNKFLEGQKRSSEAKNRDVCFRITEVIEPETVVLFEGLMRVYDFVFSVYVILAYLLVCEKEP